MCAFVKTYPGYIVFSTNIYGCVYAPSDAWHNCKTPKKKVSGRAANFSKRTSATFSEEGFPEKILAIEKVCY